MRKRIVFQLIAAAVLMLAAATSFEFYIAHQHLAQSAANDAEQRIDGLELNIIQALEREDRDAIRAAVHSVSEARGIISVTFEAPMANGSLFDRQGRSAKDPAPECDKKIARNYAGMSYDGKRSSAGALAACFSVKDAQRMESDRSIWFSAFRMLACISILAAIWLWLIGRSASSTLSSTAADVREVAGEKEARHGDVSTDHIGGEASLNFPQFNLKYRALQLVSQGISHDMNNVLGVALGYGELLRLHPGDREKVEERATLIINAVKNATRIVNRLTFVDVPTSDAKRLIDAQSVLVIFTVFSETIFPPGITLASSNYSQSRIFAELNSLEAAAMNLVIDVSRDLAGCGGRVVSISSRDELRDGTSYLCIEIADNRRVTTEDATEAQGPTKTTGLASASRVGLSKVSDFASRMGGQFEIEARVGYGRTSRLLIPTTVATNSQNPEAI